VLVGAHQRDRFSHHLVQRRKRNINAAPFVHDGLAGIVFADNFRKILLKLDSAIGYAM
jgi:hypothetical protein